MKEISAKIEYFDSDSTETSRLAAKAYGFEIVDVERTEDVDETILTIRGPARSVSEFLEDVESGDVKPMRDMRDLDDDEYAEWLKKALREAGV